MEVRKLHLWIFLQSSQQATGIEISGIITHVVIHFSAMQHLAFTHAHVCNLSPLLS